MRFLFYFILLAGVIAGGVWYSAQSLPDWYEDGVDKNAQVANDLTKQIESTGVGGFLGGKLTQVLSGQLTLNETEFNALLIASLQADSDGRKLLAVSDAVNATITEHGIELGAVINLHKVEQVSPSARRSVEKVNRIFPFLDQSRVAVALHGTPVARDGRLGIKDNFSLKVGAIPISNDSLRQLGADVERANRESLNLRYLNVKSVALASGELRLGVSPRFE